MNTKELLHLYNTMQNELLTDIDMSGSLYIEYQNTQTNE